MNIKELQDSLPYLFEAQTTPFIWGHAGIGKSSVLKAYARSKGYHFFPLYLGTQADLGDILGLADFVRDENGTAIATTFATPIWLKNAIDYCEKNPKSGAVIFLDEFNRARRDILNGIFSLALDKTFHTIKLPSNCYLVAAGNPPTDEYFVTDVNETALMSRFVHVKLEPTVDEWLTYGKDKGIDSNILSFIKAQPELLSDSKSSFELPVKVDGRSYERLDSIIKLKPAGNLLTQMMYGIIGIERTVAYQNHLNSAEKPLTGEEVLSLSVENTEKLSEWSKPDDIKASLIGITCDNLSDILKEISKTKKELGVNQKDSLLRFLTIIPKDLAHNTIKRLVENKVVTFLTFVNDVKYEDILVPLLRRAKGLDV